MFERSALYSPGNASRVGQRGSGIFKSTCPMFFTDDHLSKNYAYTQQSAEQASRARLQDYGKKCNAVFHSPLLLMCFRVDRTNQQQ